MNPAKAFAHLFSPLGGDEANNYRSPGQLSFLRAPYVSLGSEDLKNSDAPYVFIGVPFDEGNVGKPGSEDGPREFRVASLDYFPYWFEFNVDLHGSAVDGGDVSMPRVSPDVARERIYSAVLAVLEAGKTPIICGGDRSVSIPATRALSDFLGTDRKMGYLHLGAHLDMADSWAGESEVGSLRHGANHRAQEPGHGPCRPSGGAQFIQPQGPCRPGQGTGDAVLPDV